MAAPQLEPFSPGPVMAKRRQSADRLVRFRCRCGQRLKAPPEARGTPVRCPKCRHIFTMPLEVQVELDGSQILNELRPGESHYPRA